MWRASLDRIPTQSALSRRNICVGEGLCVFCGEAEETTDHLFSACRLEGGVWNNISTWCKVPPIFLFSTRDVLQLINYMGGSKTKKEILYGIFILTCWRIWKARNEKVFSNSDTNVVQIVSEVKSWGYFWYRNRYRKGTVDWKGWCNFSFTLM